MLLHNLSFLLPSSATKKINYAQVAARIREMKAQNATITRMLEDVRYTLSRLRTEVRGLHSLWYIHDFSHWRLEDLLRDVRAEKRFY